MALGEKVCVRCGRKLFGRHPGQGENKPEDDGLCPDCRGDDFAAAEIEDGEKEFFDEDEVRCPWCGKRVHHELGEDDGIIFDGGIETCPHCGNRYDVTVNHRWTYDTRRVDT